MKEVSLTQDKAAFFDAAHQVLKSLIRQDSFVMTNPALDDAAIFARAPEGTSMRPLLVVKKTHIEHMHALGFLRLRVQAKSNCYELSAKGRAFYLEGKFAPVLEAQEKRMQVDAQSRALATWPAPMPHRYVVETPVRILARKNDKYGQPYISSRLVQAAERLHEDFEVSAVTMSASDEWPQLVEFARNIYELSSDRSQARAANRWAKAMEDLGAGLGDIAYQVCCLEIGLEQAEKSLGWSARSGKIVLRIALIRLAKLYDIPERDDF